MRKTIYFLFGLLLLSGLTGCFTDNGGYPGSVKVGNEGGDFIIVGHGNTLVDIDPDDNDTARIHYLGDRDNFRYKWLTVRNAGDTIFCTAEPNVSGKKRSMILNIMVLDWTTDCKVIQEK